VRSIAWHALTAGRLLEMLLTADTG